MPQNVKIVYVVNASDQVQRMAHPALAKLLAVPAAPGSYIRTEGRFLPVLPGQIIQIPIEVWNSNPSAWRLTWTKQVEESDFWKAMDNAKVEPAGVPCGNTTVVELIAKACHEANRAYCKSIGDDSQVSWDDAPDWQKQSAVAGVEYAIANPDVTPEQMHESWMKVKADDGWVYGETKDADKKTHPCFVPYDQLPEDQKQKDHIFRTIVFSVLKRATQVETPETAQASVESNPEKDEGHTDESADETVTYDFEGTAVTLLKKEGIIALYRIVETGEEKKTTIAKWDKVAKLVAST